MYSKYLRIVPTILVSVLACVIVGGAAMAQAGGAAPQVTPSQLTIAGVTGSTQTRTLLLHLPAGAGVEAAVASDLAVTDGSAVVRADAIQVTWPPPAAETDAPDADAAIDEGTDAEPASTAVSSAEGAPSADDADQSQPVPIPLTVAIDLRRIPAAQYTGQLYVVTSAGELPVALSVAVKSRPFWPFVILLAGVALGIAMTAYRKRGRPRDQLLSEAGTLRSSIDADPQLVPDGAGAVFYTALDNVLLDAQVALRAADWEEAGRQLAAANALYVTWRKDRSNWVAQLSAAAQARTALTGQPDIPFVQELRQKLDQVVAAAPGQSNAGTLRTELVTIQHRRAEYDYGTELLEALQARIDRLTQRAKESKLPDRYRSEITEYTEKLRQHTRTLHDLQPVSGADYATAYRSFTVGVEADIKALDALLTPKTTTRGDEEGAPPAVAAPPLMAAAHVPPLHKRISAGDATAAESRLRYFAWASYLIALLLLGLAGFNELYAAKLTFGANPWADYTTLFAWGFGAEATRAAVTDLVKNWGITTGE